jgi:hypothetical protein
VAAAMLKVATYVKPMTYCPGATRAIHITMLLTDEMHITPLANQSVLQQL